MKFNPKKKLFGCGKALKILFVFIALCFAYSLAEPYMLEEKITIMQDSDVPENFIGKKIVFVSDIHHDIFFNNKRIADMVQRINTIQPDIIVLGGDYVTDDENYISSCFKELAELKAPLGVYAVTGNHDNQANYDKTVKAIRNAGIVPLENDAKWIQIGDEKIRLGGITTHYHKKSDISPTIDAAKKDDFVILAAHDPAIAEDIQTDKIDLVLSGHNHAGQVTLFGFWAPYVPSGYGQKYVRGIVQTTNTEVLVSNGVGTSFLPIRFFAPPQFDVIILEK